MQFLSTFFYKKIENFASIFVNIFCYSSDSVSIKSFHLCKNSYYLREERNFNYCFCNAVILSSRFWKPYPSVTKVVIFSIFLSLTWLKSVIFCIPICYADIEYSNFEREFGLTVMPYTCIQFHTFLLLFICFFFFFHQQHRVHVVVHRCQKVESTISLVYISVCLITIFFVSKDTSHSAEPVFMTA